MNHWIRRDRPPEFDSFESPIFLLSGGFHYSPNRNAADFLIQELFPKLIHAYREGKLVLAGANPTPRMLAAAREDRRIVVTGHVPGMIPYLQHASMMLVPLREGGGTRFKIIEAFAARLPVVSSAIGVEGLGAEPHLHFLPAENADAFLDAIGTLLEDEARRREMIRSAADFVQRFSWDAARQPVAQALAELVP